MNQNKAQKKTGSAALMTAGLILFIVSLAMDFAGTGNPMRGPMLVAGITAFLAGLYLFPSKKHHRKIVYILFLFPLLFTFGVTVIIPLLRPVITTVSILNGMWIWNDYLLPSLMLGQNGRVKTLPVAVQAFVGSYVKQWDLILTAALLAIIPMVVFFAAAQKWIMNEMVEGAVKG